MNGKKESLCFGVQSCAHCQIVTNISSLFRRTASAPFVDHSRNRHANQLCGLVDRNFELSINRMRSGRLRIYEKLFFDIEIIMFCDSLVEDDYLSLESRNRHANQLCGPVDRNFELSINRMRSGRLRIYEKLFFDIEIIMFCDSLVEDDYFSLEIKIHPT